VADFGQARNIGPGGTVKAPPLYYKTFPPEVLQSGLAVVQSDIYQIGVLLYRAANGEAFFADQLSKYPTDLQMKNAILKGKFPDRQEFLPHVPGGLRRLIRKAMKVNPTDRFDSATSIADALGRISVQRDWSVQIAPSGAMTWTSGGTTPIIVGLNPVKNGWSAETYTNKGCLRAKCRGLLWKVCQTRMEALDHLKWVFEQL
jgi:serine/threonine protein kinase